MRKGERRLSREEAPVIENLHSAPGDVFEGPILPFSCFLKQSPSDFSLPSSMSHSQVFSFGNAGHGLKLCQSTTQSTSDPCHTITLCRNPHYKVHRYKAHLMGLDGSCLPPAVCLSEMTLEQSGGWEMHNMFSVTTQHLDSYLISHQRKKIPLWRRPCLSFPYVLKRHIASSPC